MCALVDSAKVLTGSEGRIVWAGSNQSVHVFWLIDIDPSRGLVLQFHDVHVQTSPGFLFYDDSLVVYEGCQPHPEYALEYIVGDAVVEPLVVRHNRVLVVLKTHARIFNISKEDLVFSQPFVTHFNMSYTSYQLHSLPPFVGVGFYNCSPPFEIPQVFICDVVKQCLHGEDEINCWYQRLGCPEGWLPLTKVCLKIVYSRALISPIEAKASCRNDYDADLAWVHGLQALKTMARFASLLTPRHVNQVVIGLSRYQSNAGHEGQKHLYRHLWHTVDDYQYVSIFDKPIPSSASLYRHCASMTIKPAIQIIPTECYTALLHAYVCMTFAELNVKPSDKLVLPKVTRLPNPSSFKRCSDGSFVQRFHECKSDVQERSDGSQRKSSWSEAGLPLYECENGQLIHYSLVVDGIKDCSDGSDERTRYTPSSSSGFTCKASNQFIRRSSQCDGSFDCFDGTDELNCDSYACSNDTVFCFSVGCLPRVYWSRGLDVCPHWGRDFSHTSTYLQNYLRPFHPSRYRVDLDGFGMSDITILSQGDACPETHFQCQDSYCIPTYLVNNQVPDCSNFDDEELLGFQAVSCPDHYHCYRSDVCVHADFLCDGIYHCPLKDDERYCNITCPSNCSCEGFAFTCNGGFVFDDEFFYYTVRYLDLSGSADIAPVSTTGLARMMFLQYLNVSNCRLERLTAGFSHHLKVLDLSSNSLRSLADIHLLTLPHLTHLVLSNNPLFSKPGWQLGFLAQFAVALNLKSFVLHNTSITNIRAGMFENMTSVRELDIAGNRIGLNFDADAFRGLSGLQQLSADEYQLCCLYFNTHRESKADCMAPASELSSCDDLLKSDSFRVFLWTSSLVAVGSNLGVLGYRVFVERSSRSSGHRVLVTNLCVSDLLMGIYVTMIGTADATYRGQYLWKQQEWTHSALCKAAGFLAIVSNEVSAFIVCLITLDRFLVVRFPLRRRLHPQTHSAALACCAAWVLGLLIATVPLLPADWQFYSQTGICVPLPITRHTFPGHHYAFFVFVILNLLLFVLIGVGQAVVFFTLRGSRTPMATRTMKKKRQRRSQDNNNANANANASAAAAAVARRLFLVVITDFCCWFPVGVMGLLAATGTPFAEVVNVLVAIFVLPLNSMLNPLIYTLGSLTERRREQRLKDRVGRIESELRVQVSAWTRERARDVVKECVEARLVDRDWVTGCLTVGQSQNHAVSSVVLNI